MLLQQNKVDISNDLRIGSVLSPGYLFMNKDDFEDPNQDIIHLYAYMGAPKRRVVWAAYIRSTSRVIIEGGCIYEGAIVLDYDQRWRRRGYVPISGFTGNLISQTLNKYLDVKIEPNDEEYRLYVLFNIWYENKIDDRTLVELFSGLNVYLLTRSSFETINLRSKTDDVVSEIISNLYMHLFGFKFRGPLIHALDKIYEVTFLSLKLHKKMLNVSNVLESYSRVKEVHEIARSFEEELSVSIYIDDNGLDTCPNSTDECEFEPLNVKSPCSVYEYGTTLFNENDTRLRGKELM